MCPKDPHTPTWKTYMQIASAERSRMDGQTGVTLYVLSTILQMAEA